MYYRHVNCLVNTWLLKTCGTVFYAISNSYTMGCPPVRGGNPRALASGLSFVQADKHGITILCHLHQCRPVGSNYRLGGGGHT